MRALRQLAIVFAAALLPAFGSGALQLQWRSVEPLEAGEVRVATARQWASHVLWVDARSAAKFAEGHIPGAVALNEDDWETQVPAFLDAWEPEKTVVVYCDGGRCEASRHVADRLSGELQIKSVFVLKGGWPAWQHD